VGRAYHAGEGVSGVDFLRNMAMRAETGQIPLHPEARAGWDVGSRPFRVLAGALLVLFGAYAAIFLGITIRRLTLHPASGDFFALWSTARFAATHPVIEVYDAARLRSALLAQGMSAQSDYPFPYPPFFLFALRPLGWLPYLPAYLLALGATLALYLWATVGREWRSPMTAAALLAPTTTITIVAGQAGFLAAALLIGGCRLLAHRPLTAGVLFGLLSFKPQLGLLVPVALVAAREWRGGAAAALTIAALITASVLVFGPAAWTAWAVALAPYASEFASASAATIGHLMPSVGVAARELGAGPAIADAAQIAVAALGALAVWHCFRRGPRPLAAAALFVAMFLATPHAFVYDMPPLTTAVLWLIAERQRAAASLAVGEIAVMTIAMLAPIALVAGPAGPPVAVLSLALLLALIVRRWRVARFDS
jgi:hypothetical protein